MGQGAEEVEGQGGEVALKVGVAAVVGSDRRVLDWRTIARCFCIIEFKSLGPYENQIKGPYPVAVLWQITLNPY